MKYSISLTEVNPGGIKGGKILISIKSIMTHKKIKNLNWS